MASYLLSCSNSTKVRSWGGIIDRRLDDIIKVREQRKSDPDPQTAQDSDPFPNEYESRIAKYEATMKRQIRLLRQLCTDELMDIEENLNLVDEAHPSHPNETYDARIKRILRGAYTEYLKAYDKMRETRLKAVAAREKENEAIYAALEEARRTRRHKLAIGKWRER